MYMHRWQYIVAASDVRIAATKNILYLLLAICFSYMFGHLMAQAQILRIWAHVSTAK